MGRLGRRRVVVLASLVLSAGLGCSIKLVDLGAHALQPAPNPSSPLPFSISVSDLEGDHSGHARYVEKLLVAQLRSANAFAAVKGYPNTEDDADFLLQGTVNPKWRPGGASNFLTYFPGGLLFAPTWRGNRWILDIRAELELVDVSSGRMRSRLDAASSYEVIHRSANPMHFLGAALVVPGIIRASAATWPQVRYRNRAYKAAYPNVWAQISNQVVEDLGAVRR